MSPRAMRRVGLVLGSLMLLLAVGADWLAPYDPKVQAGPPSAAPGPAHWLGTNDIGQDILSELLHASRVSLTVGLLTAALATALGMAVGTLAGALRGRIDEAVMRLADFVLVLPFLPLLILVAAYAGTSRWQTVGLLGLTMWARPARIVRAQAMAVAASDYVQASRVAGARRRSVLWRHILPAVLPLGLTQFVRIAGAAITLESTLAFLGLGDPTATSWGAMLFYAKARNAVLTGQWPWWVLPPGLMIALTVVSCAFMGLTGESGRGSGV